MFDIQKFGKWLLAVLGIGIAFAAGTQINNQPVLPLTEMDKVIRFVDVKQVDNDVLIKSFYQIQEIDSVGGQIVVVENEKEIIITKENYNSCRKYGTSKEDCLRQIKNEMTYQIEKERERALEEIQEMEREKIDYTNELTEEDLTL